MTRGEAILDLVFGNEPGQVSDLSVGEHFGDSDSDSDHNSLIFTIVMERDRSRWYGKVFNWERRNYNAVRNKRIARLRVGPIRNSGGNLCLESEEVGDVLTEYFASVFTSERDLVACQDSVKQADMLERVNVRKEDVLEILKNMKIDKSPGPDGIYA
eukprot:g20671.t1